MTINFETFCDLIELVVNDEFYRRNRSAGSQDSAGW